MGTGLITWDGAVVLAKYLETVPSFLLNKNVLELGAGTGLAGMAATLLGAKATLLTGNEPPFISLINISVNDRFLS